MMRIFFTFDLTFRIVHNKLTVFARGDGVIKSLAGLLGPLYNLSDNNITFTTKPTHTATLLKQYPTYIYGNKIFSYFHYYFSHTVTGCIVQQESYFPFDYTNLTPSLCLQSRL